MPRPIRPSGRGSMRRRSSRTTSTASTTPSSTRSSAARGTSYLYFEGTYTHTFSGNEHRTPRYDYNQIMYRLDLDDPRLVLPVAVYDAQGKGHAARPAAGRCRGRRARRLREASRSSPSIGRGKGPSRSWPTGASSKPRPVGRGDPPARQEPPPVWPLFSCPPRRRRRSGHHRSRSTNTWGTAMRRRSTTSAATWRSPATAAAPTRFAASGRRRIKGTDFKPLRSLALVFKLSYKSRLNRRPQRTQRIEHWLPAMGNIVFALSRGLPGWPCCGRLRQPDTPPSGPTSC